MTIKLDKVSHTIGMEQVTCKLNMCVNYILQFMLHCDDNKTLFIILKNKWRNVNMYLHINYILKSEGLWQTEKSVAADAQNVHFARVIYEIYACLNI